MMETVSTLCATGSITGAASVGYVFGQQSPHPAIELANLPLYTQTSQIRTTPSKKTANAKSSKRPATSDSRHLYSHELHKNPFPQNTSFKSHSTVSDPLINEQVLRAESGSLDWTSFPNPSSAEESPDPVGPRSSRLQKLASFTFSSRSSPTTSLRLDAKSLTLSSKSSTPLVNPEPHSSPHPRNKLVKRSHSQHLIDRHGNTESTIPRYTLARPATRHNRLETLSKTQPSAERNDGSLTETRAQSLYKALFRPNIRPGKSHGLSIQPPHITIQRMHPEPTCRPLLLHPYSLLPFHSEVEAKSDSEAEPFAFGGNSSVPPVFLQPSSSPGLLCTEPSSKPLHDSQRRSFSIGDLLSRTPSTSTRHKSLRKATKNRGLRLESSSLTMHPSIQPETPRKRVRRGEKRPSPSQATDVSPSFQQALVGGDQKSIENDEHRRDTQGSQFTDLPTKPAGSDRELSVSFPSQLSLNRPSRHSVTPSENTSSQIGSDNDTKIFSSGDEDDGDKRSDSIYDSLRTGATRSSSGFRGPPLETLFDKEARRETDGNRPSRRRSRDTSLRFTDEQGLASVSSTTAVPPQGTSEQSAETDVPEAATIPSSPPPVPKSLRLGALAWDSDLGDDDSFWSHDEQEEEWEDDAIESSRMDPNAPRPEPKGVLKSNLFDWSEPQPGHGRPSESHLTRPKTVHGKKMPGGRSSRAAGRRTPSGLHARSQSVPVLADMAGDQIQVTSKFGTWGVGSKGIAEDWNDDFEFDDELESRPGSSAIRSTDTNLPANATMIVPDAIKEQQTNVLANIKLLKEWGIIIEELKDMRERTNFLGLEGYQYRDLFDEVDAMIELADQEAEEHQGRLQSASNSSPAVDFEGLGDPVSSPAVHEPRKMADANADVEENVASRRSTPIKSSPLTRPRKNSQAVAQTVIEAIQSRRRVPHPTSAPSTPTRKVPFDTTTLRHIVPHVSGLSKRLKQVLYDAEGLQISPKISSKARDPSLSRAFIEPGGSESDDDSEGDYLSENDKHVKELVHEVRNATLLENNG